MIEYHRIKTEFPLDEEELNNLGAQGWRLVTVLAAHDWFYFYFERFRFKG